MPRHITITLDKRGASGRAVLLDAEAPKTCAAMWDALQQSGSAYHSKYTRNEIDALVPPFDGPKPGRENPTVTPIPGDVAFFNFEAWEIGNPEYGHDEAAKRTTTRVRPTSPSSAAATTFSSTAMPAGCRGTCSPP